MKSIHIDKDYFDYPDFPAATHDLPDAELLQRLVRLNHERAREEATGLVRYLRPAYQAPSSRSLR
ncbi:hypothetical protein LJ737_06280 [Hymenobacter sp. 15J16-1T3B]|uniref:hypothetical protein n=1 Tax=Hymenobacter sp. 15J16-1T3B TaxID=2886941 RepID=UPI001D126F3B|nr:hypothetical protein [Hymenobacter sp. 15J16-1T3B]MCC3156834.1 hypothetical protein [Hymenobacter sp. 15J16-1T3B]